MNTSDKIRKICSHFGVESYSALEKILNLSNGYLSALESGRSANPGKLLSVLVSEKISADWFLTGEGPMTIGDNGCSDDPAKIRETMAEFQTAQAEIVPPEDVSIPSRFGTKNGTSVSISNGSVANIPILTQRASAGPGQEMLDIQNAEGQLPILVDFLAPHRPGNCLAIKVVGDSMAEIHLNNGDYVVFDNTDTDASGGGLFVITFRGVILVKRLEFNVEEQIVYIRSENRRYGTPQKATKTDMEDGSLRIEGKVVAWIHRHWY